MEHRCKYCGAIIDKVSWDESGYGYSVKIGICIECDKVNVLKTIEDFGLDVNQDERFYDMGDDD